MSDEKTIDIEDLPEKEVTADEAKEVKGGFGDGSVRFVKDSISTNQIKDGTSNTLMIGEN
jgi:hypothetical protein